MKGKLVTSSELSAGELNEITQKFTSLFGEPVAFEVTVDPSLYGGFGRPKRRAGFF